MGGETYRSNTALSFNLPQLQDRIKRDKDSYRDEFLIQLEHFNSMMEMFKLNPSTNLKNFVHMISFMAHVAHCYLDDLKEFPEELKTILKSYSTVIHPDVRFSICKALILLRNKSLLSPTDLLTTFFDLFNCQDKLLRGFLKSHIITDIKNLNLKEHNFKQNNLIQSFIFNKLKESNVTSAKIAIDIMGQLFKKNVWHDAKTANKIAECCFSKHTKILVTALSFFTNSNEKDEDESDKDDSDSEHDPEEKSKIIKKVLNQNKVNKKTRRRRKLLEKTTKAINQEKKKHKGQSFNFSALHLIYDPQDLADRLLRQLEKSTERYEVKLMMMDFISRLIGVHQLMVLNFYSFIQRYLQPHQKDITKILLYASQASHELVLPDIMENIVKHIAFNFITERNSPECMAVGLNTVREICTRCPLAISAELLQDFADYRTYKNKNVAMASKSLIQLYRITNPEMLKNKDRGRKTIAVTELKIKDFGESNAIDYIPGAELLDKMDSGESDVDLSELEDNMNEDEIKENNEDDEDQENNSENLDKEDYYNSEDDNISAKDELKLTEEKDDMKTSKLNSNQYRNVDSLKRKSSSFRRSKREKIEVKPTQEQLNQEVANEKASKLCSTRILDQEDFKKLKSIRIAKQVRAAKSANTKRKEELHLLENDLLERKELVSLSSIERLYKRPKSSKEERENESKGRNKLGRGEWRQNEKASKTEKERQRNKAFMMIKHKVNRKKKTSFRSRQLQIKSSLIKQLKAKKL